MSTITRRPKKTAAAKQNRNVSESQIERVIRKGGGVATNGSGETAVVNLRAPAEVIAQVDEAVSSRKPKISRHYWLLEAVLEKLERESA